LKVKKSFVVEFERIKKNGVLYFRFQKKKLSIESINYHLK